MPAKPIVNLFLMGCALIALGLIPGLAGFKDEIENLRDRFLQLPSPRHRWHAGHDQFLPGQIWLAVLGIILVLISLLASFN